MPQPNRGDFHLGATGNIRAYGISLMNKDEYLLQHQDRFVRAYAFDGVKKFEGYQTLSAFQGNEHRKRLKVQSMKYRVDHERNMKHVMFRSNNKDFGSALDPRGTYHDN